MSDRLVFGVGPVRELVAARPRAITVLYAARERAEARGKDPVAGLVDTARAAGVPVELEIYRGVTHEFIKMGRAIPEARQAHADAAAALRRVFGLVLE